VVSAGNTGAVMAFALTTAGPIPGVHRPTLAVLFPTVKGSTIVLDVGANVDVKPHQLLQFGLMGATAASYLFRKANPSVGLLNIGREDSKGNENAASAYQLFKESELNFAGNVEGNDIMHGSVDVVVCDGFVGNVLLKYGEGLAEVLSAMLDDYLESKSEYRLRRWFSKPVLHEFIGRMDYQEHGGALMLDEIAEMPATLQAKLLRVLQEKTVYHLGGTTAISVDVRIIAATNKDIKKLVEERKFREDLYFQLAVFPIELPPLRKRKSDIALLAENYLGKRSAKAQISAEALDMLREYGYPGNVRELENILERGLILSGGREILPEHLPDLELCMANEPMPEPGETTLDELEKKMLVAALDKAGGNKSLAAKYLGITRRMIYTRLKKYGIEE